MQSTPSIEVLEVEAEDSRKRGSFGAPLLVNMERYGAAKLISK